MNPGRRSWTLTRRIYVLRALCEEQTRWYQPRTAKLDLAATTRCCSAAAGNQTSCLGRRPMPAQYTDISSQTVLDESTQAYLCCSSRLCTDTQIGICLCLSRENHRYRANGFSTYGQWSPLWLVIVHANRLHVTKAPGGRSRPPHRKVQAENLAATARWVGETWLSVKPTRLNPGPTPGERVAGGLWGCNIRCTPTTPRF